MFGILQRVTKQRLLNLNRRIRRFSLLKASASSAVDQIATAAVGYRRVEAGLWASCSLRWSSRRLLGETSGSEDAGYVCRHRGLISPNQICPCPEATEQNEVR